MEKTSLAFNNTPKSTIALTKLLGEFVVRENSLEKSLIVRTNFVERAKWLYEKASANRYGTYLFADDLSPTISDVMRKDLTGIVHACGEEKMSMFELARLITLDVKQMTIAEYKGPPVTMDMSLRSIRLEPYRMRKTSKHPIEVMDADTVCCKVKRLAGYTRHPIVIRRIASVPFLN